MAAPHIHPVRIYYEDTDFSGVVYHANYLKYAERAREHLLGIDILVEMYNDTGIGFVVYKAGLTYRQGAVHGDALEVQTTGKLESAYRVHFWQNVHRVGEEKPLVEVEIDLVCVDAQKQLVPLPDLVVAGLAQRFGAQP